MPTCSRNPLVLAVLVAAVLTAGARAQISTDLDVYGPISGRNFGQACAIVGDVNNDGHADFAVAAPNANTVHLLSGADGSTLKTFNVSSPPNSYLGYCLAGAGDVNGDGCPDLVVGAPYDVTTGPGTGTVYVYSGLTGATIHTLYGLAGEYRGFAVDGAGDVNNDGYDDIIVGSHNASSGLGQGIGGFVRVYSGQNGSILHHFSARPIHEIETGLPRKLLYPRAGGVTEPILILLRPTQSEDLSSRSRSDELSDQVVVNEERQRDWRQGLTLRSRDRE